MKPHTDFDTFITLNTPRELAEDCQKLDDNLQQDCLHSDNPNPCGHCQHYASLVTEFGKQQPAALRAHRAQRAHRAITHWRYGKEKDEADFRDLLTDLIHYATEQGIDFNYELNKAQNHYIAEA